LSTNASCISGASCFFSAAGRLMRPFASILHSCTPMRFNMCFDCSLTKVEFLSHDFPQTYTLWITFEALNSKLRYKPCIERWEEVGRSEN
jgi:hypothetical protein